MRDNMIDKSIAKALESFGDRVVHQSKENLKRLNKGGGDLEKSISSRVENGALYFSMEDYWTYVDFGVKGVGGTKADGSKWQLKRVTNNKYKYTSKKPPARVFSKWSIRKGIAPRNKKGQFQNRKSLQFALATSVYHTGIATTGFFNNPLYDELDLLIEELGVNLTLELEDKILNSFNL